MPALGYSDTIAYGGQPTLFGCNVYKPHSSFAPFEDDL